MSTARGDVIRVLDTLQDELKRRYREDPSARPELSPWAPSRSSGWSAAVSPSRSTAGHVAVCDADGTLIASAGDPDRMIFARSCMKPLQAAVSLTAIDEPLPDREVGGDRRLAQRRAGPRRHGQGGAGARGAGCRRAAEPARMAARRRDHGGLPAQAQAVAQLLGQARGHAAGVRPGGLGPGDVPAGEPSAAAPGHAGGAPRDRPRGPDDERRRVRGAGPRHAAAFHGHAVRTSDRDRTSRGPGAGRRPCDRGDAIRALPGRRPQPRGHGPHADDAGHRGEVGRGGPGMRRRAVVRSGCRGEDRGRREPGVRSGAHPGARADRRSLGGRTSAGWRTTPRLRSWVVASPSERSKRSSTCGSGVPGPARGRNPLCVFARNILSCANHGSPCSPCTRRRWISPAPATPGA